MTEFPTHLIRRIRHPALGVEEKAVLMNLADRMRSTTDVVWPSVETIASDCGMSERGARYVIGWLVSNGLLVVVEDGRRTRSFRIDFERLECLPGDLSSRSRKEKDRHPVPPSMHHVHLDRHLVQVTSTGTACTHGGTGEQGDRHGVHHEPAPGAPEGIRKEQKKDPAKDPNSARVPRRSNGTGGEVLTLDFGQSDPPTATTIPRPALARPGALGSSRDTLPASPPSPPPKGKGKAGKNRVRKFTDEQISARDVVYKFWKQTYFDEFKVYPIVGNTEVGQMVQLLIKVNWDSNVVCALITNAFNDVLFREKIRTIGHITANPSKYQTPTTQKQRVSSGQVEPPDNFWDEPRMEDLGS